MSRAGSVEAFRRSFERNLDFLCTVSSQTGKPVKHLARWLSHPSEETLEAPDVAQRIDEQVALAALEEVQMRPIRGARIEPASKNAVRDLLWKVRLWRNSSADRLREEIGTADFILDRLLLDPRGN